ncbi:hypothetical protein LOTGIDRAFT_163815 [Lottia gigantea]|uniref:Uncharacterized protein n=1 Tax=Lottia gigantea TaxID=225164 RepID=V4BNX8_LOTGI|nr:hypothetical protein LOTGIDRAFT_163815 [Lottia gigantea]ESO90619.1 hypothetical protein LOTGIDRAFT_163815 [Lottia gigantea]
MELIVLNLPCLQESYVKNIFQFLQKYSKRGDLLDDHATPVPDDLAFTEEGSPYDLAITEKDVRDDLAIHETGVPADLGVHDEGVPNDLDIPEGGVPNDLANSKANSKAEVQGNYIFNDCKDLVVSSSRCGNRTLKYS